MTVAWPVWLCGRRMVHRLMVVGLQLYPGMVKERVSVSIYSLSTNVTVSLSTPSLLCQSDLVYFLLCFVPAEFLVYITASK